MMDDTPTHSYCSSPTKHRPMARWPSCHWWIFIPKKTSWCLLAMHPQGHQWTFHSTTSFPATLTSRSANCQQQPICCINPHKGITVVGVIQALLGTQKLALMALQAKANSWEQALCMGFIPCLLAWMALNWVIWPFLWYALAVTSFSELQALSITSRLYQTLLPCPELITIIH